jgi:hypothetical protein
MLLCLGTVWVGRAGIGHPPIPFDTTECATPPAKLTLADLN